MAALKTLQAPTLIQLPDGRIIPASGGALVDAATPKVAAAMTDNTGALGGGQIKAAGDGGGGAIAAADADPSVVDLASRRRGGGGAAAAPSISTPRQPDVMYDQSDAGGDAAGILNMIKSISAAAGKSSGSGGGTGTSVKPETSTIPAETADPLKVASSDTGSGKTGFLDQMKSFLGIGSAPAAPAVAAAAPQVDPVSARYADKHPGLQVDASTGQLSTTPTQPQPQAQTQGALPAAAEETRGGFFDQLIDHGDPLTRNPVNAEIMKTRYGDSYEAPSWFDRLSGNKLRMALLQGGLATMANASRPGATPLGAIGSGALAGMEGAFTQAATEREQTRKEAEEASQAKLREAQGVFYGDRGQALVTKAETEADLAPAKAEHLGALTNASNARAAAAPVTAQAAADRAKAANKNADANMIRAQKAAAGTSNPTALMKNADWLVRSGVATDTADAVNKLKSAARNPGQRASLVTARAKFYLSGSVMQDDAAIADAKRRAEIDVDRDLAAAAPAPAAKAPNGGGALGDGKVDVAALRAEANKAIANKKDPAAVKARFKKMTGQDL